MEVYDLTAEKENSLKERIPERRSARLRDKTTKKGGNIVVQKNSVVPETSVNECSRKRKTSGVERRCENTVKKQQSTISADVKRKVNKERRIKRFRSSCSEKVQQRIERAEKQRMFLLEREVITNIIQKFAVLGSTGNVYNVHIGHLPDCDCPDYARGNLCKHILFVYLKVLRVSSASPYIYQAALLTSELEEILANAPDLNSLANERARKAYEAHRQGAEGESHDPLRKPIVGECPICYEEMKTTDKLVWCKVQCGNNIHEDCWSHWSQAKKKSGTQITCVYCRADWNDWKGKAKSGYLNLGKLQEITKNRY